MQSAFVQCTELLEHDHRLFQEAEARSFQQYMGGQIAVLDLPRDDGGDNCWANLVIDFLFTSTRRHPLTTAAGTACK